MTAGRRRAEQPPSTEAAASEIACSNSTLNMFLGGKKRPWMCEGGQAPPMVSKPVRLNPPQRPAVNIAARAVANSPTTVSSERYPASNSTSPQLSNIVRPQPSDPKVSTVLPSPAPSDELNNSNGGIDGGGDHDGEASMRRWQAHENRPPVMNNSPNIRPSDSLGQVHRGIPSPYPPSNEAGARFQAPAPPPQSPLERPAQAQVQNRRVSQPSRPRSVVLKPRPPPSLLPMQAPVGLFNYESGLQRIEAYHSSLARQRGLTDVEFSRIRLLEEACSHQDWLYLTLHQYFCLATINPAHLPTELTRLPAYRKVLDILEQLLVSNQTMSQDIIFWFANFPYPLQKAVVDHPRLHQHNISIVIYFFVNMDQKWQELNRICTMRCGPPTARELVRILGLESSCLQRVIFIALLRRFWGRDQTHAAANMERLFRDQQREYISSARLPVAIDPTQIEQEYHRHYRGLHEQHHTEIATAVNQSHNQTTILPQPMTQQQLPPQLLPHGAPPQARVPSGHVRNTSNPNASANHPQAPAVSRPPPGSQVSASIPSVPRQISTQNLPVNVCNITPQQYAQQAHVFSLNGPIPQQNHAPAQSRRNSHVQPYPSQSIQQPAPVMLAFLPAGVLASQPSHANPDQSALHQAHLRSPILRSQHLNIVGRSETLYQHTVGFVFPPKPLSAVPIEAWEFTLSEEDYRRIPQDDRTPQEVFRGEPPVRNVNVNSRMYRLRCVRVNSPSVLTDSEWSVADTSWAPHLYLSLNGAFLEQRKKLHHGKDLPIDINTYLKEGVNCLEVAMIRHTDDLTPLNYALAVEVVGAITEESIRQACSPDKCVPSQRITNAIKANLSGPVGDEELAVVSSSITINLFDPFSACRIFDIPVRGKSCLHHDCFDLETFLSTRRRRAPDAPGLPDEWRCPICKADARPQSLIVDGFLVEVRAKLAEQGLLDTRAIIVEQDGSWRPRPEKKDRDGGASERDDSAPAPEAASVAAAVQRPSKSLEVVDLDSD